jgi:tRNA A-37 threonylcarbamoyl transferase component Bud32
VSAKRLRIGWHRYGSIELKHESRDRSAIDFAALPFDDLWVRNVHAVDQPNLRGSGTSTVGIVEAGEWPELGSTGRAYVKRQQAFFCRPPWNAFRRTPTLRRELRYIDAARALGVSVPDVAYYAEAPNDRALLVVREIEGVVELGESVASLDTGLRRDLFENLGKMLVKLHAARIMHGAIYPKHVLVEPGSSRVWLIDFEKARRVVSRSFAASRDIARLVRHARFMTDADLEALTSVYNGRAFPDLLQRLKSETAQSYK